MYLYPGNPIHEQVEDAFPDDEDCAVCLGFIWQRVRSEGDTLYLAIDIAPQVDMSDTSDLDLSRWLEDHLTDEDSYDDEMVIQVY